MTTPASRPTTAQAAGSFLIPLILVTSLFFMWGVANTLNGILIPQFQKSFSLTNFQSGLVQSAFNLGYFLLALPAARIMKRFGYKTGIIIGLVLYATGAMLFFPAAEVRVYGLFLMALFVIASGLAFLETAANPFVTVLGPAETSEKRLNLSQAFNSLGAIMGIVIGRFFILSGVEYTPQQIAAMSADQLQAFYTAETKAVQTPYLVLGIIVALWAVFILFSKLPDIKEEADASSQHQHGFKNLLGHQHFVAGVVALFLYVGAQVGTWSYLINYAKHTIPGTSELAGADYLTVSLICLMLGRFSSTFMMKYFRPNRIMALFAAANALLALIAVVMPGIIGLYGLVVSSFFMSLMFPTIFALSIKGLGNDTKIGSSILIMAIVGGAVITALMGLISDQSSITVAFLLPAVSYLYILWFAIKGFAPKHA